MLVTIKHKVVQRLKKIRDVWGPKVMTVAVFLGSLLPGKASNAAQERVMMRAVPLVGDVLTVIDNLQSGNELKKDMERGGEHHADNFCHTKGMYESAVNGPISAVLALGFGVAKEGYDFVSKVARGDNISEVFDDNVKDMKNNIRGIAKGLDDYVKNFSQQKDLTPIEIEEAALVYLSHLNLETNEMDENYNNGLLDPILRVRRRKREELDEMAGKQNSLSSVDYVAPEELFDRVRKRLSEVRGGGVTETPQKITSSSQERSGTLSSKGDALFLNLHDEERTS